MASNSALPALPATTLYVYERVTDNLGDDLPAVKGFMHHFNERVELAQKNPRCGQYQIPPRLWWHSGWFEEAFRKPQSEYMLARTLKDMWEESKGIRSQNNQIRDFDLYTISTDLPFRLIDSGDVETIVSCAMAWNSKISDWMKETLCTSFVGSNFVASDGHAQHVGNYVTLRDLHKVGGDEFVRAVAGPNWEEIADMTYMKMAEADHKALPEIFRKLPDSALPLMLRLPDALKQNYARGLIHTHWAGFKDDYDGYTSYDRNGGACTLITTDAYLTHRQRMGPAKELFKMWRDSGKLDALTEMVPDNKAACYARMADPRGGMNEMFRRQQASNVWVKPEGWRQDKPEHQPLLDRVMRLIP